MASKVPVVLYMLIGFAQLTLTTGRATLIYKMAESQFNKLAKFSLVNTAEQENVNYEGLRYTGEPLGRAEHVRVTTPRDGILRTTAHYDSIFVTGAVELKLQGTFFLDYSTVVMFNKCSYLSEGNVASLPTVNNGTNVLVSFKLGGVCQFRCHDYSTSGLFNRTLGEYANQTDILERLQATVCENYRAKFDLTFKVRELRYFSKAFLDVSYDVFDTHFKIVNSNVIMVLEAVISSSLQSIYGRAAEIPDALFNSEEPFEIWIHTSVTNEAFHEGLLRKFQDNKNVTMSSLMKHISKDDMQKLHALIPKIGSTFPESVADVIITNMTAYSTVSDNAIWMHGNVTGAITVRLNCDNRTFTAFTFRALMAMTGKIAYDRKRVGKKLEIFRGNFTVLETNIGRVADRFLESIFYILPQLVADRNVLKSEEGGKLHGLRLKEFIPNGYFMEDVKLKLTSDFIVIGGRLTTVNPERHKIPYENLTWIGEVEDREYFYFPFYDDTPENTTGLPIQNCTGPTRAASASESVNVTFSLAAMIAMCLAVYHLSRDVNL